MAKDPSKIAQQLIDKMESSIDGFVAKNPKIESSIMSRFQRIVSELETLKDGTIKPTVKNLRKINEFSREMRSAISQGGWDRNVKGLFPDLDQVEKLQYQYFETVASGYSANAFMREIKKSTIDQVSQSLLQDGLSANVVDKASTIIQRNITEKATLSELVNEMSTFIQGNEQRLGILSRYSRVIVTDSLNQYAAQLNKTFTDDLGLQWYRYVGSLVNDSRAWCIAMVAKEWIHESELPAATRGSINGQTVSLAGLIPGTDANNVQVRRGGYNCNHMMLPVSTDAVPKDVRARFEKGAKPAEEEEIETVRKVSGKRVNLKNKTNTPDKARATWKEYEPDYNEIQATVKGFQIEDAGYLVNAKRQGYLKPVETIDKKTVIELMESEPEKLLFRGWGYDSEKIQFDYLDNFNKGKHKFLPRGVYGNGYYYAGHENPISNLNLSNNYTGSGKLSVAKLKPSAKIIHIDELAKRQRGFYESQDNVRRDLTFSDSFGTDDNLVEWFLESQTDYGAFATSLGYDAIYTNSGSYVVLNPTALIQSDVLLDYSTLLKILNK